MLQTESQCPFPRRFSGQLESKFDVAKVFWQRQSSQS